MRFLFLASILLISPLAWAQNDAQLSETDAVTPVTEDKDSVRRYYIKQFPEYFFVYPVLKQRSLHFELAKRDKSSTLTYKPNNTYNLGLGVYLFELGLELSFAIPLKEQSLARFGESEARDIQLNVLSKRWGADVFFQRYKGFYLVDKENEPLPTEPFPQRPDINTKNFGITTHYVFNNQKFSFRSAYNFAERQLYSKGSLLLFGALNTFRVRADSSIVNGNRQRQFGEHVDFTRLRYTTFAIAPGYTFNLTYNNFFLNTTLAVGPAHHWVNYDLEASPSTHHDTDINTFVGARVAIGYNGYRIFGGISFISQGSTIKFDSVNFSNNNSVFKILVGYRFREFGILRKRVWDMIPFEI
ncbi:MAG: DUF4421 family protein [Chryseosolibacter sp.]